MKNVDALLAKKYEKARKLKGKKESDEPTPQAQVALVALDKEGGQPTIVGGGRYVVVRPGQAEVAFAVIDEYQGQGIGAALMRHLAAIARQAGLGELIAEVLSENAAMLKVFEKSGLEMSTKREGVVVHVSLRFS